jgi:triacylglycerol esterase/lipase EstA (alpha/beta hydrolase family)
MHGSILQAPSGIQTILQWLEAVSDTRSGGQAVWHSDSSRPPSGAVEQVAQPLCVG